MNASGLITDFSKLDLNKLYTYADYLTWRFEQSVELFSGKVFPMSPAPKVKHQRIAVRLTKYIAVFLDQSTCEIFVAPFDVRLYNAHLSALRHEEITTVVQPDLCVICDSQKLDELGGNGAPDWVIEILSEGNSKKEMRIKYELYEAAGVREYWVVDPEHETVHQFVLDEATHKFRVQQIY
ncbi:MAG TPA: restriction endonuclease, partial [Microscillaceae bacterium]|nr:restriction endonuclease [Microscillaceae bacterium]